MYAAAVSLCTGDKMERSGRNQTCDQPLRIDSVVFNDIILEGVQVKLNVPLTMCPVFKVTEGFGMVFGAIAAQFQYSRRP